MSFRRQSPLPAPGDHQAVSWPRNRTGFSCITGAFFTSGAAREALCSPALWIQWVFSGVSHKTELQGIKLLFYMATFSEDSIFWESSLLLCVLFTEAPTDGQLGYLQLLALMNQAAMNIHLQVFVWTCFHFSWQKKNPWQVQYIFNFVRNCQTLSQKWLQDFPTAPHPPERLLPSVSLSHSSARILAWQCGFNLQFPMTNDAEPTFCPGCTFTQMQVMAYQKQ